MQVVPATAADAEQAAKSLSLAFSTDPLINFFFHTSSQGVGAAAETFFSVLLRARVAMGMPALLAKEGDELLGVVMGYTTERPEWPEPFNHEWDELEASAPGIVERFEAYEHISDQGLPPDPHYYLGVIGVKNEHKGKGVGRVLLDAFCRLSADDPLSSGVYLETGNPGNLPFYRSNGFELRAEGQLGMGPLWCLFHPHSRA
jgi:ribosomal protein S18 acetylase RimI-like enzyme